MENVSHVTHHASSSALHQSIARWKYKTHTTIRSGPRWVSTTGTSNVVCAWFLARPPARTRLANCRPRLQKSQPSVSPHRGEYWRWNVHGASTYRRSSSLCCVSWFTYALGRVVVPESREKKDIFTQQRWTRECNASSRDRGGSCSNDLRVTFRRQDESCPKQRYAVENPFWTVEICQQVEVLLTLVTEIERVHSTGG
jgi:hypothetical protein